MNDRLRDAASYEDIINGENRSAYRPKSKLAIACSSNEFIDARSKTKTSRGKIRTELTDDEKWILIIALVPHIYPHYYDEVIFNHLEKPADYPQLGFIRGRDVRGFYPTGETVFFLLAGNNFDRRVELQRIFQADHIFSRKKLLWLEELPKGDPLMSGKLILAQAAF